ncbi:MAG: TetR family transcriptional regulator [Planctomycetota bacterium]|nr:TetR family transcriptional regulator [Planctomycetota bacterium]
MDTRERILAAAERLAAEHGFAGTSLRSITADAGVNLASVNYHFGSKEGLIQEVFGRLIRPVNRERLELLDALEGEFGEKPIPLDRILEAFVGPAIRMARDSKDRILIRQLLGMTYSEPSEVIQKSFTEQFREIRERFGPAFRRTLPDLAKEDFFWRLHFSIGAMAHTLADPQRLEAISDGACDPYDEEETVTQLVQFLSAGMGADRARSSAGMKR